MNTSTDQVKQQDMQEKKATAEREMLKTITGFEDIEQALQAVREYRKTQQTDSYVFIDTTVSTTA